MDTFSERLTPANKPNFHILRMKRLASKIRSELTDLILASNENDYFDLDGFYKRHGMTEKEKETLRDTIMSELTAKGWKCKTSFNGTGLFIYSTAKPPPSCFDGDF
jgi:hypothetical protein